MKVVVKHDIDLKRPIESLLQARGLETEWLEAGPEHLHDGHLFKNYEAAKELLLKHIAANSKIGILVD